MTNQRSSLNRQHFDDNYDMLFWGVLMERMCVVYREVFVRMNKRV